MSEPPAPDEFERVLQLYEAYRSYVRHEDSLINFRTTWFLGIEGVLLAILGLCVQKRGDLLVSLMTIKSQSALAEANVRDLLRRLDAAVHVIPFLGLAACLIAGVGIWAAHRAIEALREQSRPHQGRFAAHGLPGVIGGGANLPGYLWSLSFLLPALGALVWFGVLMLIPE